MIISEKNLEKALTQALDNSVWKKEGKSDKIRKFDESLDVSINLRELDIKNPQNRINSEFLLPNPIHPLKMLKLCFITEGDQLVEAKNSGYYSCDKQFLDDFNKKDTKAKKAFVKQYNSFICRTDLMKDVARVLGRFLGQSGKMPKPSPKGYGIVSLGDKVDKIIENFQRRIIVATKKAPIIQTTFGKKSNDYGRNKENLLSLINFVESQLPNGQGNIRSIYLKTTMGKSAKVEEPKTGKGGGKK